MKLLLQLFIAGLMGLGSAGARAAALDEAWQPWDRLLSDHVVNGYVDYTALSRAPEMTQLVELVEQTDPDSLDRLEQLVFYINAYNVLSAQGIIEGRSPETLLGRAVFFKLSKYSIGGESLSLYALEHERIIPLQEPRIHFAIVCASHSCPVLRSEAYNTANLDSQLDSSARQFLADTSKNQFDKRQRIAWLSSIFKWFREDFERHSGSLQAYLAQHVADPEVARLLRDEAFEVRFLDYDWSLNGSFEP